MPEELERGLDSDRHRWLKGLRVSETMAASVQGPARRTRTRTCQAGKQLVRTTTAAAAAAVTAIGVLMEVAVASPAVPAALETGLVGELPAWLPHASRTANVSTPTSNTVVALSNTPTSRRATVISNGTATSSTNATEPALGSSNTSSTTSSGGNGTTGSSGNGSASTQFENKTTSSSAANNYSSAATNNSYTTNVSNTALAIDPTGSELNGEGSQNATTSSPPSSSASPSTTKAVATLENATAGTTTKVPPGPKVPVMPGEVIPMESHVACQLLSTSFAWYLQAFLGLVCFASLVGKRFTDKVRRPWKVWFLDTSKQGFSAFLVHFLNILLSMGFERFLDSEADPCNWYWINLTLDDTLGIGVCFILLKCMQCVYRSRCVDRPELALSGEYGDPPSCRIWSRQLLDWQLLVMIQKTIFCAFVIKFTDQVAAVAGFLLGWLDPFPRVKLVVVMVITPLTMNMFALWMADSFLQAHPDERDEEHLALRDSNSPAPTQSRRRSRLDPRSLEEEDDSDSLVGFEDQEEQHLLISYQEWKHRLSSEPKPTRWGKKTRA